MYKIILKRDECIGCGMCASLCDNWEMKPDGKASPKKTLIKEIGCNKEAADSCPVNIIKIEKTK